MNSNSSTLELFQRFMNAYSAISDNKSYSGSLASVQDSDGIILLGTHVTAESQELFQALESASKTKDAKILYAHPIEDMAMSQIAQQFMKYEPGAEEGLLALMAYHLLADVNLPESIKEFLGDLDLGYLEAESNIGEEEFENMLEIMKNSQMKMMIIGSDVMAHPRAQNIAKLSALIEKYSDFSLLIMPDTKDLVDYVGVSEVVSTLEAIDELPEFNGTVIYNIDNRHSSDKILHGSAQFARAAKIDDGDFISVSFAGVTIERRFKVEDELKGTIAINPTFDISVDPNRYKFERSQINKINQNSESNNE